ncbi:kinase-like protein [Xylaria sp. FL0043]|nr:kinase-like protein [Xylaria sp. FL0043]
MFAYRAFHSVTPNALIRPTFRLCAILMKPDIASVRRASSSAASSAPREFPSTGFEVIDAANKVEEERLPFYQSEEYYPMRIGEVVGGHYQVSAKLGYGTTSTVWLARDLRDQRFWALKVHINTLKHNQELEVYRHLASATTEQHSRERQHVRQLETSFKLNGPHGEHEVFVMTPLKMSLQSLLAIRKGQKFDKVFVKLALNQVLVGLMYLHEVDVVHTDLHLDNLLISVTDASVMSAIEENEMKRPSARKLLNDRTIHISQTILGGGGPLTICDFGQARIGKTHRGDAMPTQYRAPEIILDMEWGNAVDLWSVGLIAWDLLEQEPLFSIYDQTYQENNDIYHLAAMTALLGPPPPEFLKRSEKAAKYWDKDGQWIGPVPLPSDRTLESLAKVLTGEEKDLFIDFIRFFLWWLPEERVDALHSYFHPWLGNKNPNSETEENAA